jgi:hypothetical protein
MHHAARRQVYERLCRETGIDPYPEDEQPLPSRAELRELLAECRAAGLLDDPRVMQLLRWLALENRRTHRAAVRAVADLLVEKHLWAQRAELFREELGMAGSSDSSRYS